MNSPITKPGALPVNRDEVTSRHKSLERSLASFKPRDRVHSVGQALRAFEEGTRTDREQRLKSTLAATRDHQVFCTWVAERYDHLLQMARSAVSAVFDSPDSDKAMRSQACAVMLTLSGHAVKWRRFAGLRTDPAAREWAHQVFRTAVAFTVDSNVISVRIEDQMFDATVEALYVRALLVDRFAGGNLAPKRMEVLDHWLTAWMSSLWLTREPAAGEPTLGINTNGPRGLVPHQPGDGAHLFLSLKPLERQLDRTLREFHHGRIFPGWGIGQTLPMEDHAGVVDFLEREFALIESAGGAKVRGKRVSFGVNQAVGVFFGFKEICAMAFATERLNTLAGGGAELGVKNAIQLADVSEGGVGLDVMEDDARRIGIGELVAIRLEKGKPCVVGVVVRKSALQRPTATLVGVKILGRAPVYSAIERVDEATNSWQPSEALLIAGASEDGMADSVLLAETTYVANAPIAVTLSGDTFVLNLRRVREQGPGWRLAAFDAERAA
ncbi:MAG: hypothetical protein JNK75_08245 [Betaproteobacteria bacterium]|nr:hypothetical protein [Betaproteobacteria bacterium]